MHHNCYSLLLRIAQISPSWPTFCPPYRPLVPLLCITLWHSAALKFLAAASKVTAALAGGLWLGQFMSSGGGGYQLTRDGGMAAESCLAEVR